MKSSRGLLAPVGLVLAWALVALVARQGAGDPAEAAWLGAPSCPP
ncbi:MAG: hypothetical protein R3F43_07045 [bacterium]